jgi:hypothetical protein
LVYSLKTYLKIRKISPKSAYFSLFKQGASLGGACITIRQLTLNLLNAGQAGLQLGWQGFHQLVLGHANRLVRVA